MTLRPDPFESPKHLIGWVEDQVNRLNDEARAWLVRGEPKARPYVEPDPITGENVFYVEWGEPVPVPVRGLASSCVKDLRDALDQAMAASSEALTGKASRRTHFPFGDSPENLENALSKRRVKQCRDIPEELFAVLRSFEPYPSGPDYRGGDDALKILNRVSGPNKHRMSLQPGLTSTGLGPGRLHSSMGGVLHWPPIWEPRRNRLKLLTFPAGGDLKIEINFQFIPSFASPSEVEGMSVVDQIIEWHATVLAIVNELEAETIRLLELSESRSPRATD